MGCLAERRRGPVWLALLVGLALRRYQQTALISYTFTGGNGFSATLSLEDDGNNNYVPNIVGVIALNQGWGGVWVKVAYDEDVAAFPGVLPTRHSSNITGTDGWAAQAGLQLNVPNSPGSSFRIIGYYANNANDFAPAAYAVGRSSPAFVSQWSVLASYGHQINTNWFGFSWCAVVRKSELHWRKRLGCRAEHCVDPCYPVRGSGEYNYLKPSGAAGIHTGFLRFTRYF